MRTTVNIDDELLAKATKLAGDMDRAAVLMHPLVLGEIACGSLKDRGTVLELLQNLPAAAALSDGAQLWTRDKRLCLVAEGLGCAFRDTTPH